MLLLEQKHRCTFFAAQHICWKCHITAAQAKVEPSKRQNPATSRSLKTLKEDLKRFTDAGGDQRKAKLFNNVIGECFFQIPIDQVRPAELQVPFPDRLSSNMCSMCARMCMNTPQQDVDIHTDMYISKYWTVVCYLGMVSYFLKKPSTPVCYLSMVHSLFKHGLLIEEKQYPLFIYWIFSLFRSVMQDST